MINFEFLEARNHEVNESSNYHLQILRYSMSTFARFFLDVGLFMDITSNVNFDYRANSEKIND